MKACALVTQFSEYVLLKVIKAMLYQLSTKSVCSVLETDAHAEVRSVSYGSTVSELLLYGSTVCCLIFSDLYYFVELIH